MERMRQADGDIEKHDVERRHQLIRYRLLAAFSGLGPLLDVVDDGVDDGVEVVVVDLVVVVEDDLGVDLDLESSHDRLLPLPRGDYRPPLFEAKATYDSLISHETRSQPPKKPNNTSLHQSRSHLVLTSACQ